MSLAVSRRSFLSTSLVAAAALPVRPNIIYIVLDDLGLYDLGCYGCNAILTPHIDKLAREGMRFTQAYSGGTVSAPARCTLMTGSHTGHATIRRNSGGVSLRPSDVTIADLLSKSGYNCGGFGKWGLADLDTPGVPERHGFSKFYGYYHKIHAQYHYPEYLIDTGKKVPLPMNKGIYEKNQSPGAFQSGTFSEYLIFDEMKKFIASNQHRPFFCYAPWTLPHGRHEIPESDPAWKMFKDKPWNTNARVHAAFVAMADRFVGEIMAQLKGMGLESRTLIFLSSDNGADARYAGEIDSSGSLRGLKSSLYEGGIRIPLIARWPGKVKAGETSDLPIYLPDILPTIAAATDNVNLLPSGLDGISLLPEMDGTRKLNRQRTMYWEWSSENTKLYQAQMQACRRGEWKIVRHDPKNPWELYDLSADPGELKDLAQANSPLVGELDRWIRANRNEPPAQVEPDKPKGMLWR